MFYIHITLESNEFCILTDCKYGCYGTIFTANVQQLPPIKKLKSLTFNDYCLFILTTDNQLCCSGFRKPGECIMSTANEFFKDKAITQIAIGFQFAVIVTRAPIPSYFTATNRHKKNTYQDIIILCNQ